MQLLTFLLWIISLSTVVSKSVTPFTAPAQPAVNLKLPSISGWIRDPRGPYYAKKRPNQGPLPGPVQISSSIRINHGEGQRHLKRQKRNEPENDKRPDKRQILIQDPSQLLGSQTLLGAPQLPTIGGQTPQPVFYAQQHPQQYTIQQGPNGAFYATPSPFQFQAVTALPMVTPTNQLFVLQNGNTPAAPQVAPKPVTKMQQSASKLVARTGEAEEEVDDQIMDETIAAPARVAPQPKVSIVSHADPNSQQDPTKREPLKSQHQIQYEEAQLVLQNIIKQQALQQTQQQRQQIFQLQQQALQQQQLQEQFQRAHLQQLQEQLQEQQQQQQKEKQQLDQQQQQQYPQQPQQQYQQPAPTAKIQTTAQTHQHPAQHLSLLPAANQAQQFILPGSQHLVQQPTQQQQQQQPFQKIFQNDNRQNYAVQQKPQAEPSDERQSSGDHSPQTSSNFVMRPQTYVNGPVGQKFTLPSQVQVQQQAQAHNSREENSREVEGERENQRRRHESEEKEVEERKRPPRRPMSSFMRRVMEAFSVRGDASERVGTNIALPILASTGVLFGLGALAAGWYLSNTNREVGILRRTGKPVPPGTPNVKRIRRQTPEVDQATFFQTIIQQAIEKQQEKYEVGDEADFDPQGFQVTKIVPQGKRKPISRHDIVEEEHAHEEFVPHSKVAHGHHGPSHKKPWLGSRQALNFAKVAIPAIILAFAVVAIGVTIFGWYITGSNREIAFLEPSAYSRRLKRDITTTALTDGWFQRVLTSIHENPYEKKQGGGFDPFPLPTDTSKNSLDYHANVADAVVAVSLGVVAFFSLMGIVFAWLAAQNEKSNLGVEGSYGFGGWPGSYRKSSGRAKTGSMTSIPRHLSAADETLLESWLAKFQTAQERIPKLEE